MQLLFLCSCCFQIPQSQTAPWKTQDTLEWTALKNKVATCLLPLVATPGCVWLPHNEMIFLPSFISFLSFFSCYKWKNSLIPLNLFTLGILPLHTRAPSLDKWEHMYWNRRLHPPDSWSSCSQGGHISFQTSRINSSQQEEHCFS